MVVRVTTERGITANLRTIRLVEVSIGNFINLLLINSSFVIHVILKAHLHILFRRLLIIFPLRSICIFSLSTVI